MKKIIALILAVVLCLTFAACSHKGGNAPDGVNKDSKRYFAGDDAGDLVMPENSLDAEAIYAELTYIPEMFYGRYGVDGIFGTDTIDYYEMLSEDTDFFDGMTYMSGEIIHEEYVNEVSELPFRFEAGPETLYSALSRMKGRHWMDMLFMSEEGDLCVTTGAFTVEGHTLIFTPIEEYNYDKELDKISYRLSENSIEYGFSFSAGNVTLTRGNKSVTYIADDFDESYEYAVSEPYYTEGSARIGNIDYISCYNNKDYSRFTITLTDDTYIDTGAAYFGEDGLLTFSWKGESGEDNIYQFVYFFCGDDGLILADGEELYCYTSNYWSRYSDGMDDNLTFEDLAKLESMDEAQLEEIAQKRTSLLADLSAAFADAGIAVQINEATGEIALDSAVLFGFDEYELSEEGKSFLEEFIGTYSSVILSDTYEGFVSKIYVEGHTDSSGDYDYNLELSQKRAESVMAYALTDECVTDASVKTSLKTLMVPVGYSSDQLVYDENGAEDEAASRRVAFRFMINVG